MKQGYEIVVEREGKENISFKQFKGIEDVKVAIALMKYFITDKEVKYSIKETTFNDKDKYIGE